LPFKKKLKKKMYITKLFTDFNIPYKTFVKKSIYTLQNIKKIRVDRHLMVNCTVEKEAIFSG
jgi:hypothetical protein